MTTKSYNFGLPITGKVSNYLSKLNTVFPRKLFFFETYGATTIQGRKVFKGGNYCFCSQFNFKFAINMQQNNDETLESPAEKDYHRYLDVHWS